jgi:hypothetical protein
MLRLLLSIVCLCLLAPPLLAQRLSWKPADFAPLTAFAWQDDAGLPINDVLKSIYREPDLCVRYTALASYLETVPVKRLEAAFKACLLFDGTQCPDDTVDIVLSVWGRRDPMAAMAMARKCFAVVITVGDPLSLDSWNHPPTQAMEPAAFRSSSFYLTQVPCGLGPAIESSNMAREDRIKLLQDFATLSVQATGKLPSTQHRISTMFASGDAVPGLRVAFERGIFGLPGLVENGPEPGFTSRAFDAACVRLVALDATKLPQTLEAIARLKSTPLGDETDRVQETEIPSDRFLKEWERLDYPSLLRWTETQPMHDITAGVRARGMLMSRVDEETRLRWVREASELTGDNEPKLSLFGAWALWNPEAALKAALETKNPINIIQAGAGAVRFAGNRCHHALAVIRNIDIGATAAALPEDQRDVLFRGWGLVIMEQWIDVDVGEAARYGFDFLARQSEGKVIPRNELVRLLSGDDSVGGDGDMVDRTFCALRFWAIWKPDDMRRWIETVKDDEMRKALTWLLEHAGETVDSKLPTAKQ